ncbi:hypothetical protein [uncultured Jatrophihabitans sp.]|uniref:hypothetical protein n=1 Tax=uncultured Jatrophihabitans sp. TaxID=1610747 RepID=UPI0035CB2152
MSSPLSALPVDKRKQLAATLGLFSVLFVAVGTVAATGPGTAVIRAFVIIALVVALLLALLAWGVLHSLRIDAADTRLDAAIETAIAASPQKFGQLCNCGHQHDPTELHITDADQPAQRAGAMTDCSHDGAGAACAHDCASCILGTLRPLPSQTRGERLSS